MKDDTVMRLLRQVKSGEVSVEDARVALEDATLTEKAQDCARRLGLRFERRYTGYGDLETALGSLAQGVS